MPSYPELFVETGKRFRDGSETDGKLDLLAGERTGDPACFGSEFAGDFGEGPGFGFLSRTRRMRDDRPEKTLVKTGEADSAVRSLPRSPRRWSVNVPGTLIEIFPARSMKSMPCSMQ